jgi:hypothetical protein
MNGFLFLFLCLFLKIIYLVDWKENDYFILGFLCIFWIIFQFDNLVGADCRAKPRPSLSCLFRSTLFASLVDFSKSFRLNTVTNSHDHAWRHL